MKISQRWAQMALDKGDLITRCEQYARWTVPGIMPEDGVGADSSLLRSYVIVGPRLINNLSNKIVEVMFPQSRPFFSVTLSADVAKEIRQTAGEDELAAMADQTRREARWLEEYAVSKMRLVEYRPTAVDVAQQLIVCGNVLMRRLPNNRRIAYNIRDYCVRRNLDGSVKEVVLKDSVMPADLSPYVLEQIKAEKPSLIPEDETQQKPMTLYTHYTRASSKMWQEKQEIEDCEITGVTKYTDVKFPCIALAWSLRRGEHYGRGLVEEHRVVFHNLDRTGEALFDMYEIAAEIKFLVKPGSLVDVTNLNRTRRGSYHSGQEGDVTAIQVNKYQDLQVVEGAVARMERELSYAFLSGAGTTREAERVTAMEIQYQALELETAFGGLYSRLALEWQQKEAEYLLATIGNEIKVGGKSAFDVQVTTGLESLSREGELANFRASVSDLALLNEVPEDIRTAINPQKVASFLFGQRGVKFSEFLYTADEMAAMQQQRQEQAQQEQQAGVQAEAAKVAMKEA